MEKEKEEEDGRVVGSIIVYTNLYLDGLLAGYETSISLYGA